MTLWSDTAVMYRYGCTIATRGDKVLWYPGYMSPWIMRWLLLFPVRYEEAQ